MKHCHLEMMQKSVSLAPSSATRILRGQSGFGVFALIVWIAILGSIFLVGMRAVPIFNEYMEIRKVVRSVKLSGDANAIRSAFDMQLRANYIDNFAGKDLIIETLNGITTIQIVYQRAIPVVGPLSFLLQFDDKEIVR